MCRAVDGVQPYGWMQAYGYGFNQEDHPDGDEFHQPGKVNGNGFYQDGNGLYQGSGPHNDGQLVQTGTGTGHFFNVTNNTHKKDAAGNEVGQTFVFQSNGVVLGKMYLKPGETGTFECGPNTPGIRITTSGANGETNGDQTLFEDNIANGIHSADSSYVAGRFGYDGRPLGLKGNDGSGGHAFGDGSMIGSYDYDVEDQVIGPTNPMQLGQDTSNTYNLSFYDPI